MRIDLQLRYGDVSAVLLGGCRDRDRETPSQHAKANDSTCHSSPLLFDESTLTRLARKAARIRVAECEKCAQVKELWNFR
jgi:hypothetical protein